MKPYEIQRFVAEAGRVAQALARDADGVQRAFQLEREAERDLLIDLLQAVRPALRWIADHEGPVDGVLGDVMYRQVTLDERRDSQAPDRSYSWVALEHPDLGLVIARKYPPLQAERVWPGADLPFGREGGPRLNRVLGRLIDRLAEHAAEKVARKRQEAASLAERLRAVQTLLRAP